MSIETKQVQSAKEIDEVMVLFIKIVENRRKSEDLSKLMGDLTNALVGIDQVDDELKASRKAVLQTIGYRSGELIDAFLPSAVVPL